MTYYNTVPIEGEELKEKREKAEAQTKQLEDFFRKYPKSHFTDCQLWMFVFSQKIPLTSARRARNTLKNRGVVEKTGNREKGFYGDMVNQWRLAE